MTIDPNILISYITASGIIVALIIFLLQQRSQNKMLRADFVYRLEDKYDQICKIRIENPNIMNIAENWDNEDYSKFSDEEKIYFFYIELIMGFVDKSMSQKHLKEEFIPLVKYEVQYHKIILSNILKSENFPISLITRELIIGTIEA